MKSFFLIVSATLLFSGCIVRDEVTTISIRPDGSAGLVIFHSNIRSTEEGIKGDRALKQYVENFDAGKSDYFLRIIQAGGETLDARWIQSEAPCSSVITANLPAITALEKLGSIGEKDDGFRVATRYSENGSRHRLTTLAQLPEDFRIPDDSPKKLQQDRADSFSETRIIVIDGKILAAQGWTVASDKRSALLSLDEIVRLLRDNPDQIELFIEWETTGP